MEINNDEKIIITLALEVRRDKWMVIAKDRISYLKEIEMDVTNDADVAYFVNCVNECSKLIGKVRESYGCTY